MLKAALSLMLLDTSAENIYAYSATIVSATQPGSGLTWTEIKQVIGEVVEKYHHLGQHDETDG